MDIKKFYGIIEKIKNDNDINATFSLDHNLELKKLNKLEMLEFGNFIYGINEDTIKKIFENIYIFLKYQKETKKIFLGKGKDPKTNKIIIEIVRYGNNKNKVLNLAKYYKQFSIYDIFNDNEIIINYGKKQ